MPFTSKRTDRRDHYLPQGYLRGFIDPTREKEPQPLWRLDLRHNLWRQKSTKEVGHLKGLYDYAGELAGIEIADTSFSALEDGFTPVREALISGGFRDWAEHRDFLLQYMQMLRARSALFLHQAEAEGESLQTLTVKEVSADGKSIAVESMVPKPPPRNFIRNRALTLMRKEIEASTSWLDKFNWSLKWCDSVTDPFVSCDSPFVATGPIAHSSIKAALDHPQTELLFPVCWQACLFGSRNGADGGTARIGAQALREVRRL